MQTSQIDIDDFLGQKRIAMVGISRNQGDFSRGLFRELLRRGYDVVPVNPNAPEIEGQRCFAQVSEIEPAVAGALLFTPPGMSEAVVRDCDSAGVRRIWMHRGAGSGAVNRDAVQYCREHGMAVIPGECPYMFLPDTGWFHRFHRMLRRLVRG